MSRALSDAQKRSDSPTTEESNRQPPKARGWSDTRSPLRRFRTAPKKPLSVSDLTAGTWCELQYFYTLTKLGGKRTRTAAMKGGTAIHERLERELYEQVHIEIEKKEDNFGLKIWNIIQGLRTLRDTGMTREIEVWGLVDGNVVNGIVDILSYDNPDPELEGDVISSRGSQQSESSAHQLALGNKVIFIRDIKTRGSKTPPSQPAVRTALIQLFLYHRFLAQMASEQLDFLQVFERYGLDPDESFSDRFMAQIGDAYDGIFSDTQSETTETTDPSAGFVSAPSSPSQIEVISDYGGDSSSYGYGQKGDSFMKYRTLRSLLPLLKFELQLTFPRGAATLGQIVAVEYRYRARSDDDPEAGSIICTNSWYFKPDTLDAYLEDNMRWWRGEREPRGVPLEEGFKCRYCDFVGDCEWQTNLEQEALRKVKRESAEREESVGKRRVTSIQW